MLAPSASPALAVEGLTCRFGGLVAVNSVSLAARAGEIFGIIGQNGAGKTTLFNAIAGAIPPSEGRIRIGSEDVTPQPAWRRSRAGISRTFQIPQPVWSLSVIENVQLGLVAHGKSKAESRRIAIEQLVDLGLGECLDRTPSDLSPGQLRLLEFARASALRPLILLLDEVFAGLSYAEQRTTAEVIRTLRSRSIAIIWIEHNVRLMMELADVILVMDHGSAIATGTPGEIAANEQVVEVYLGSSRRKAREAAAC